MHATAVVISHAFKKYRPSLRSAEACVDSNSNGTPHGRSAPGGTDNKIVSRASCANRKFGKALRTHNNRSPRAPFLLLAHSGQKTLLHLQTSCVTCASHSSFSLAHLDKATPCASAWWTEMIPDRLRHQACTPRSVKRRSELQSEAGIV